MNAELAAIVEEFTGLVEDIGETGTDGLRDDYRHDVIVVGRRTYMAAVKMEEPVLALVILDNLRKLGDEQ